MCELLLPRGSGVMRVAIDNNRFSVSIRSRRDDPYSHTIAFSMGPCRVCYLRYAQPGDIYEEDALWIVDTKFGLLPGEAQRIRAHFPLLAVVGAPPQAA